MYSYRSPNYDWVMVWLLAIYSLRLYLKAENVFLFLISEGSLLQSLDPFTLKDDLYKELLHLGCCRVLLVALRVETVCYSETEEYRSDK